jgi:predicted Zn-dependent protease
VTTSRAPLRIPRTAAALRLPLWQRGQARMRERFGFDLNSPDARDRVQQLVAANPSDADMLLLRASVLATQGDNHGAELEVRRALEFQPDLARAHTTLATLLVQRGEQDEGLREARRAAELDGSDPTVQYNLGLAEFAAGNRSAANQAFDAAWKQLYGEAHQGARPPWWRRIFRRGTVGTPPPGGADSSTKGQPTP